MGNLPLRRQLSGDLITTGVRQAKRVKEKEPAGGRTCKCKGPEVGTVAVHLSSRELSIAGAQRIRGLR